MIEVFELDEARRYRNSYHADVFCDMGMGSDGMSELGDKPHSDYITQKVLDEFAARPHFAQRDEKENLVWSATVRADPDDFDVMAVAPRNEMDEILRKYTLPVDTGMDDYMSMWAEPWRVVVTAVRPDGKMCQIIDVQGRRKLLGGKEVEYGHCNGFKEIGGDGQAGQIEFAVVEEFPKFATLSASVVFLPNAYGPRLAKNTSDTLDALDIFKETAYESTGFLYQVGFKWLIKDPTSEWGEEKNEPDDYDLAKIALRLSQLEWF